VNDHVPSSPLASLNSGNIISPTAICSVCHEEKLWAQMEIKALDETRKARIATCADCLEAIQIGQGKAR